MLDRTINLLGKTIKLFDKNNKQLTSFFYKQTKTTIGEMAK